MMIGTDMEAFRALYPVGALPIDWYPMDMMNPSVYTPLEELPEDVQILYDYNPTLAKQMLADAGHPDGLEIYYYTDSLTRMLDRAALLQDMWAKIGVTVTIRSFDAVSFLTYWREKTYIDTAAARGGLPNPMQVLPLAKTGDWFNGSDFSNERYDELIGLITQELDEDARNLLIKEAAMILRREVPYIPTGSDVIGHYWWPWIKNYYGEQNVGDWETVPIFSHAWLDEDLKEDMGY